MFLCFQNQGEEHAEKVVTPEQRSDVFSSKVSAEPPWCGFIWVPQWMVGAVN